MSCIAPEVVLTLMSWAASLSGYPRPLTLPTVECAPQAWIAEQACLSQRCNVYGWCDKNSHIYIDERFAGDDSAYAASIIVHEMAHVLMYESGEFDNESCADSILMERRAYRVQSEYLVAHGAFYVLNPTYRSC